MKSLKILQDSYTNYFLSANLECPGNDGLPANVAERLKYGLAGGIGRPVHVNFITVHAEFSFLI